MVSTKIIYRTDKKNKDGEHPLYLRLIKNRKSKYISMGVYLDEKDWDKVEKRVKKTHPNAQRLNKYIAQKISEAEGVALELESTDKFTTPRQVKNQIFGNASESFFTLAAKVMQEKEQTDSYGTYCNYNTAIKQIRKYNKDRDLLLDEITINWLKDYEISMLSVSNLRINTIHTRFKIIRKIINEAITRELLPFEKNPFNRFKLKTENVQKSFLTEDELITFENMQLEPGSYKDKTRNIYVFASYAAGLRVSDILELKWHNFDGEKLLVKTQKTGTVVSVKLATKALEIITLYKTNLKDDNAFIFPFLNQSYDLLDKIQKYNERQKMTQTINNNLKLLTATAEINKHIHMHCSRHGFAVRALQKGMRIEYVSKLMGHASIKTTQIYAKIVNADLDKAMEIFN